MNKFFSLIFTFFFMNHAFSMDSALQLRASGESMEYGTAYSVGVQSYGDIFYGGLSLSHIESTEVIQRDNRKIINPIFFYLGLRAPWVVSPYIEVGIDLPEAIIDDLLDNAENSQAQADYYFAGGLQYGLSDKVSLSLYAKRYNFIYRETIYSPTMKTRPRAYGVGISFAL